MPIGTVKFFNPTKGFGFIAPDEGGADNFVHISAVERSGMTTLDKDQRVKYEVETDKVTQVVDASGSGTLLEILVPEGEEAQVGDAICVVEAG